VHDEPKCYSMMYRNVMQHQAQRLQQARQLSFFQLPVAVAHLRLLLCDALLPLCLPV